IGLVEQGGLQKQIPRGLMVAFERRFGAEGGQAVGLIDLRPDRRRWRWERGAGDVRREWQCTLERQVLRRERRRGPIHDKQPLPHGETVMVIDPDTPSSVVAVIVTVGLFVDTACSVITVVAGLATNGPEPPLIWIVDPSDDVQVTSRWAETSVPNVSRSVAFAVVLVADDTLRAFVPAFTVTVPTWPITVMLEEPDAGLFALVAVMVTGPAAVPVAVTRPLPSTVATLDPPLDHVTPSPAGVVVAPS